MSTSTPDAGKDILDALEFEPDCHVPADKRSAYCSDTKTHAAKWWLQAQCHDALLCNSAFARIVPAIHDGDGPQCFEPGCTQFHTLVVSNAHL